MGKRVFVIGGGASGLIAAIFAARSGASVTILEKQEKPGKKLLVTGNGRCNLTNLADDLAEQYHGTGAALAARLTKKFGAGATVAFFKELGLLTQEKNGWVYPYTMQASSVLEVLLAELRRNRVKLKFSEKILAIADQKTGDVPCFLIQTPSWTYQADAVILACGSKASPSTGASDDGYVLAEKLGHTIVDPHPALVPFSCRAPFLNRVAGVRCRAKVTLLEETEIAHETGELQWTSYGVSGIAVFQLSRYAAARNDLSLSIDLLPDFNEKELTMLLMKRAGELTKEPVSVLLRGLLNEKLIAALLSQISSLPKTCAELSKETLSVICGRIKDMRLPVIGTRSFDQAQICIGGIHCGEVTDELESKLHQGLYFAGEMLDIDGPCGGYNLQWAWTSGALAGTFASHNKRLKDNTFRAGEKR